MSFPLVSVIVPTKNEEKNILCCLKSIKNQKFKEKIEIIVVDNFSQDKTVELAGPYADKIILAGPERSIQRNIGAKEASGSWFLFLDADMEVSPTVLAECIKLTKDAVVPPIIAIEEISVGQSFWGKALSLEKNCYKYAYWLWAVRFIPKKYFFKIGGYDENLISGEDWDLTQRLRNIGLPTLFIKNSYLIHHESQDNLLDLLKKEAYYIKHIGKYAKKHPFEFSYQGSFLYRGFLWARSWGQLLKNPLLTLAFLWYKFLVWMIWKWMTRKIKI